jgi:2-(1,2-epoxy-1,2-dihydrophenyl)acetyl-CoA isomerase
MSEPTILYAAEGGVARLTLNRPERLNSFNARMHEELRGALARAASEGARALVLTGAGRGFCAGQDLGDRQVAPDGSRADLGESIERNYRPLVLALRAFPAPTVAAVNGVAAGAGASLAFACDLRIVADTAGFNLAFANVALSCDTGASYHLQRLVGRAKAIELLYFPSTVPAAEALELGLATKVVPAADLAAEVGALAARLAAGPTVALGAMRQSVAYAAGHSFEEALEFESAMMTKTGATADHRAAVAAFVAKAKPVFEGR